MIPSNPLTRYSYTSSSQPSPREKRSDYPLTHERKRVKESVQEPGEGKHLDKPANLRYWPASRECTSVLYDWTI